MKEKDVLVDGVVEDEADPLVNVAAYRGQGSRGRLVARRWHFFFLFFLNCLLGSLPFSLSLFLVLMGRGRRKEGGVSVGIYG